MHLRHLLVTASCVLLVACGDGRTTTTVVAPAPAPEPVAPEPERMSLEPTGSVVIERRSEDDIRPVFAGTAYDEPHLVGVLPLSYAHEPRDGRPVRIFQASADSVGYWLTTYRLPDAGTRFGLVSPDGTWSSGPRWRSMDHVLVPYTFDGRERQDHVWLAESDAGWEIHASRTFVPVGAPLVPPQPTRAQAEAYLQQAVKIEAMRRYDALRDDAIASHERRMAVAGPAYQDFLAALESGNRTVADLRRADAARGYVDVDARYYLRFGGSVEQLRHQMMLLRSGEMYDALVKAVAVEEQRAVAAAKQQREDEEKERQAAVAKRRQEHNDQLLRDVHDAMNSYDQWEKGRTDRSFRLASDGVVLTDGPSLRRAEDAQLRAAAGGGNNLSLMECYVITKIGRARFDEWRALRGAQNP